LSLAVKFNAEKGEFVATGKLLPAGKVAKLFEKFYSTDFDDNLYNYFTDESLMAFKLAIKPLDVYDEYKKYAGNMAGYDQNIAALVKRYDPKITSILGHFTGDLLASLSSVSIGDIPDFTVAAGILEGKAGEVAALVEGLGFTKTPEGYYALGRSFYFAVNDKAACLTGTLAHVKNFLNGGSYKPNITAAAGFGAALKNAPVYFYWDVNINKYPAILKSGIAMTPVGNSILPLLERLDAITVRTVDTNGSEFKVKFTNKNDYASKTFLQSFDEWAFQYFRQYME
ncbi:MAG: DUF4836 family protein, partial [Prevotellaceae bacterium]|jgi:hypothetical protein|nr:DUF4836 family protein [Prevotellaceae bacterium]